MTEPRFQPKHIMNLPLELKATGDAGAEAGTFEGYGAIFGNLDRDGDVVSRGAFAESLKGRMPALLWQHNAKEPIGRFDVVREDAKGLFVKGRLSMEGRGREAYELLKMGALDGLSIGFVTKEASRNALSGTRTITEADLMEISLVTFPANELARVTGVKSTDHQSLETPRDFERFLREQGFSRSRAKAITAKGFGGFDSRADEAAIAEMVAELKARKEQLEEKGAFDALRDFFGFATALNSVSLFPGEEHDDIAILPVAPGKVRFAVKAPHGVRFECFVRFYRFDNGRAIRDERLLTHNKPSVGIDRGIQKSAFPDTDLHEIYNYLSRLPKNLVVGSTRARLKHLPYDTGDPRTEHRSRVKFILSAKGE